MTLAIAVAAMTVVCACGNPRVESDCGPSTATVTNVVDGDTVDLEDGTRIRYLLVDATELRSDDCFSTEAADFNKSLVLNKEVTLEYDVECEDRFGRTLAYVSVDGREINSLLVERGFACVLQIPPNGVDREAEFSALEQAAKNAPAGMWATCEEVSCD